MVWQLLPFRIGAVSQPCTGTGLAALVRVGVDIVQTGSRDHITCLSSCVY